MTFFYRIYQLFIALPLFFVATVLTSLVTCIGCFVANPDFWGYYPAKCWSVFTCFIFFIPVHVEGRELLDPRTSYVFVANHQGYMDIFLIYGHLRHTFKWMMKAELRKMPFIGIACEKARHIFVDRSSSSKVKETIHKARQTLQDGTSLVVFPEGTRTYTGHLGKFRKGAYLLADELQLPVVPITINGSFDIFPRTRGFSFLRRYPLTMTIHRPILPQSEGITDIRQLMEASRQAIHEGLTPKYKDE
jgi:1-acyl-sn-glycerol-3-phosphate acyltransferase